MDVVAEKEGAKRRWEATPPPKESFEDAEGAEEDGSWVYDILGEEVDYEGTVYHEVRWANWSRRDGTKATWEVEGHRFSQWKTDQRILRKEASKSPEIEVMTTLDIHNLPTYLRSQAFDEKLKSWDKDKDKDDPVEAMDQNLARHQLHVSHNVANPIPIPTAAYPLRKNQRASTRHKTEQSLVSASSAIKVRSASKLSAASSFTFSSGTPECNLSSFRVLSSNTPSHMSPPPPVSSSMTSAATLSTAPTSRSSVSEKAMGKRRAIESDEDSDVDPLSITVVPSPRRKITRYRISSSPEIPDGDIDMRPATPPPLITAHILTKTLQEDLARTSTPRGPDELHQRQSLQTSWTSLARAKGAARVIFVNQVDDEAVPNLDPSFRYLESSYDLSCGMDDIPDDFLIACSCTRCYETLDCECQAISEVVDEGGKPMSAYTSEGLFTFTVPRGVEVVECNRVCSCTIRHCKNRISQQPRSIPIEIFKTRSRGWGVRSPDHIIRGKVLGVYTGMVIRTADALDGDLGAYCFEIAYGDNPGEYTVDSRTCGNWTRFINHSCEPNLQVFLVAHDAPPGTGRPYIVFVASRDIPPFTEFTFDYYPGLKVTDKATGNGMETLVSIPDGAKPCQCGSSQCRGYFGKT